MKKLFMVTDEAGMWSHSWASTLHIEPGPRKGCKSHLGPNQIFCFFIFEAGRETKSSLRNQSLGRNRPLHRPSYLFFCSKLRGLDTTEIFIETCFGYMPWWLLNYFLETKYRPQPLNFSKGKFVESYWHIIIVLNYFLNISFLI